jgi:hypothetical protein
MRFEVTAQIAAFPELACGLRRARDPAARTSAVHVMSKLREGTRRALPSESPQQSRPTLMAKLALSTGHAASKIWHLCGRGEKKF